MEQFEFVALSFAFNKFVCVKFALSAKYLTKNYNFLLLSWKSSPGLVLQRFPLPKFVSLGHPTPTPKKTPRPDREKMHIPNTQLHC